MTDISQRATGKPALGNAYFQGNEKYIKQLDNLLLSDENLIAIFGVRRIGKTSCVREYFRRLNENNSGPIGLCIDIEAASSISEVIKLIIKEIHTEASKERSPFGHIKNFAQNTKDFLAKYLPDGSVKANIPYIDLDLGEFKFRIPETSNRDFFHFLTSQLDDIKRPIYLAIDELPDVILKMLEVPDDRKQVAINEVDLLLSCLREFTQNAKNGHKLILLGSSNIILTLKEIGLEQRINSKAHLPFFPMSSSDALNLFKQLCRTPDLKENLQVISEHADIASFFNNFFTKCSPSDVQYFVDNLHNSIVLEGKSTDNPAKLCRSAYQAILIDSRGVSYYHSRLDKYYKGIQFKIAEYILRQTAVKQIKQHKMPLKSDLLKSWVKDGNESIQDADFMRTIDNLKRDMLIDEDDNKLEINNKPFMIYLYNETEKRYPWDHVLN